MSSIVVPVSGLLVNCDWAEIFRMERRFSVMEFMGKNEDKRGVVGLSVVLTVGR